MVHSIIGGLAWWINPSPKKIEIQNVIKAKMLVSFMLSREKDKRSAKVIWGSRTLEAKDGISGALDFLLAWKAKYFEWMNRTSIIIMNNKNLST